MNDADFDFLKESVALKAEALKLAFRSFADPLEREDALERLASAAESLGYKIGREGASLPAILSNDRVVGGPAEHGYHHGVEILERTRFEAEYCSEKSWKALSTKEQEHYLEEFDSLCAQGVGENCRFYRFLMDRHLSSIIQEECGRCGTVWSEVVTNSQVQMPRARPAVER
jgi:hypothetical protein